MSFKSWLYNDIFHTFLNAAEFGEEHELDGRKMICIIDSNEVEERGKKQFEHSRIDGIYEDNIIVHAISLDGKMYRVTDSRDEGGMYSITMKVYNS